MGLQMTLKSEQFIIVILSIVIGAVIGEWIDLEKHLNRLGNWIESKMKPKEGTSISQGFVTATLIFCVGSMAILGALDSGIRNDHNLLITKGILRWFYIHYSRKHTWNRCFIFSNSQLFYIKVYCYFSNTN